MMKTKLPLTLIAVALLLAGGREAIAQTISIGSNQYAFQYSSNPNYGLFFNASGTQYEFRNGSAANIFGFDANTGALTNNLRFEGAGALEVGNNRYAFRSASNPGYGLFFNASGKKYEFRNASAQPVMSIDADNGEVTMNRIGVTSPFGTGTPGRQLIRAARTGNSGNAGTGTSWAPSQADRAISGFADWGNSYSAAVYGSSVLDFNNSAAVLGTISSGTVFGALGYKNDDGVVKAGYFNGNTEMTGDLDLGVNSSSITPAGARLTIAPKTTTGDSLAVELLGNNNYVKSNNWVQGSSSGVGIPGVLSGDYVMSNFGTARYVFWTSYFKPVQNNSASLGNSTGRWTSVFATNGTINTSDARDKANVQESEYGLEAVMKLKPVNFEWKENNEEGRKIGFIAQDLLEVIPEVVVTKEKVVDRETGEERMEEVERLGVYYSDLIPVLTKAIQEQNVRIEAMAPENTVAAEDFEALKAENELLKDQLAELAERMNRFDGDLQSCCFSSSGDAKSGNSAETDRPELGQNVPNPFNESTVINYYLPHNVSNALIRVTAMDGRPVKDLQLGIQAGTNRIEFQTSGLASGTYLYSLFVNGEFISTKKMMIAR